MRFTLISEGEVGRLTLGGAGFFLAGSDSEQPSPENNTIAITSWRKVKVLFSVCDTASAVSPCNARLPPITNVAGRIVTSYLLNTGTFPGSVITASVSGTK